MTLLIGAMRAALIEKVRKPQPTKAALEAEAKAAAEEQAQAAAAADAKRRAEGRRKPGKKAKPLSGVPAAKAQRNFTDPDSRILKSKDGFIQGYNAQAAVDGCAQIIVAQTLAPGQSDQDQLVPLVDAIETNLGCRPKEASADAGYCSEANLAALAARGLAGYVAVARAKRAAEAKRTVGGPFTQEMQRKLKQVVEPVFGQIKQARGFRQFLLRGAEKVRAEWAMICTAHNILKLANAA